MCLNCSTFFIFRMFLQTLTSAAPGSTQTDVKNLYGILLSCAAQAAVTFAGQLTRSNYPSVSISGSIDKLDINGRPTLDSNGNPMREVINFASGINLLDLLEMNANEPNEQLRYTATGVSGEVRITPELDGIDVYDFQIQLSGWPAAAANVVTSVAVYLSVAPSSIVDAGNEYYVYQFNGSAGTNSSQGGPGIRVFVLDSTITSASSELGTMVTEELRTRAQLDNGSMISESGDNSSPNVVWGYINYLPLYPYIRHQVAFSASGTYLLQQRMGA